MRLLRLVLAAGFALILLATPTVRVAACSCMEMGPQEAAAVADAVFSGTVVGAAQQPNPAPAINDPVLGGDTLYTFAVDGVAKGDVPAQATVFAGGDGASCGMSFAVDSRYLVFGTAEAGTLTTHLCAGNLELAANAEAPLPMTPPSGEVPTDDDGPPIAAIGVLAAVLGVAALSFLAFRRPQAG